MSNDLLGVFRYIFLLLLILILVVYFAGGQTLIIALGNTARGLIYALTNRTNTGQFIGYNPNAPYNPGKITGGAK